MTKKLTWFEQGYAEAKQGLPSDPPQFPGHGAYKNYRDGYQCAEHEMDIEALDHDPGLAFFRPKRPS